MILEPIIVITNNPMSMEQLKSKHNVEFIEGTVMDVYKKTRDFVHNGHILLTHPLMSSVKPNETPYRTVIITEKVHENIDFQSLNYIEESIHATEKFLRDFGIPKWNERILADFQLIDFDLIYHAIN